MSCYPSVGCGYNVVDAGCGRYTSGGCRGNPCGGPIPLPGAPCGEHTYTTSCSEDSAHNTHVHDHCHTLNVYNNEQINVLVNEVEYYDQHVNYANGGIELVCTGNDVSGDIGSWGSCGGFGGYGGPQFTVGSGGYSGGGYYGAGCGTRGGSCGPTRSRVSCGTSPRATRGVCAPSRC